MQAETGSVLVRALRHSSVVSLWGTFWEAALPLLDASLLPTCCHQPRKAEWAPQSHSPPPLIYSLHLCRCTHAVARRPGQSVLGHLGATSITAAATDSYLVQLHFIRCPPPSSWAAGALIRWHNHDVVPPGKEGKHKHWTLSHLSGRSPNNTCHMPPKDNLLLSLPSKQLKGSVRKRPVFQLHRRREYSC